MDTAAIERLIARINWGYTLVTVSTQDNDLISLQLRPPNPKEQSKAASIYSIEYQRARMTGLPSNDEAIANLIALDQWSLEKESEIEALIKDSHTIRKGLLGLVFNITKLEKARDLLRRAEAALITRLNEKHLLLQNSAESHAEISRQRYLVGQITETEDDNSFWKDNDDFDECSDDNLIVQLCEGFFQKSRIAISFIRELARSQSWRVYWDVSKKNNDLFDNPISSWSLNQRELAHWSCIYDSVYDAFERPSKQIIEDDDLLDSWFIHQGEKIDSKTNANAVPKSNKPGRNEEFIMTDEEGSKQVYRMNNPGDRAKIKARQKILSSKGSVKEQNMPDSQMEMREQFMAKQKKHVKSINHR